MWALVSFKKTSRSQKSHVPQGRLIQRNTRFSGTGSSMAAALTAGCVAQFMEWAIVEGYAPFGESRTIKSNLIRGAVRESNVTYPDERWGYGKLNISRTFEVLART